MYKYIYIYMYKYAYIYIYIYIYISICILINIYTYIHIWPEQPDCRGRDRGGSRSTTGRGLSSGGSWGGPRPGHTRGVSDTLTCATDTRISVRDTGMSHIHQCETHIHLASGGSWVGERPGHTHTRGVRHTYIVLDTRISVSQAQKTPGTAVNMRQTHIDQCETHAYHGRGLFFGWSWACPHPGHTHARSVRHTYMCVRHTYFSLSSRTTASQKHEAVSRRARI